MNNNKDNKEFVMPNGFKITGNINYYTKVKLEGIAAELEEICHFETITITNGLIAPNKLY